jgi:murein hydrolase activator
VVLAAGLAAGAAHAADPVRENAEQLEKLRARIQAVQESLGQDRSRRDELRVQLEEAERRYTELAGELRGLRQQIAAQTAQRRRTELQRQEAEAQVRRQRAALARQVRAAYVIGHRGPS